MDWLSYIERIADLERRLHPLNIVAGEAQGLKQDRVLEGVYGGFKVRAGKEDRIWLSDGTMVDVATEVATPRPE